MKFADALSIQRRWQSSHSLDTGQVLARMYLLFAMMINGRFFQPVHFGMLITKFMVFREIRQKNITFQLNYTIIYVGVSARKMLE